MSATIQLIHSFPDSISARDCNELGHAVASGDVLLVDAEGVVGVCSSYPFAVTQAHGRLTEFCYDSPTYDPGVLLDLVLGIKCAVAEAERRGYEIAPAFNRFKSPAAKPVVAQVPVVNADVLAVTIKSHIESAAGFAAIGTPVTATACAEGIAKSYASAAGLDEQDFLAACGVTPS